MNGSKLSYFLAALFVFGCCAPRTCDAWFKLWNHSDKGINFCLMRTFAKNVYSEGWYYVKPGDDALLDIGKFETRDTYYLAIRVSSHTYAVWPAKQGSVFNRVKTRDCFVTNMAGGICFAAKNHDRHLVNRYIARKVANGKFKAYMERYGGRFLCDILAMKIEPRRNGGSWEFYYRDSYDGNHKIKRLR